MSDTAYFLTHVTTELLPRIAIPVLMLAVMLGVGFGFLKKLK